MYPHGAVAPGKQHSCGRRRAQRSPRSLRRRGLMVGHITKDGNIAAHFPDDALEGYNIIKNGQKSCNGAIISEQQAESVLYELDDSTQKRYVEAWIDGV